MDTQYLKVASGTIAYDDTGHGPLVVCVPGLGDVRASYRFLTPYLLDAGYRVVTMDLRGQGESSVGWPDYKDTSIAQDVLALVHALNAGAAFLLGNSYGGAAVAYVAPLDPKSFAGLVLLDAFVRDVPQTLLQRVGVWAIARLGVGAWTSYYKSLYKTTPPADLDDYVTALRTNLKQQGRYAATKAMTYGSHATVEAHLHEIQAPTLIVMGSKDPDFPHPATEAQHTAEQLQGASTTQVQMIEGAGHYPHVEMPAHVAPLILSFFHQVRG